MRRQLSTETRCWTHHIFERCYHNHPPMKFSKSVEIIEGLHQMMIEHLFKTYRHVEIKRSIGTLKLIKYKPEKRSLMINWKKGKVLGRLVKEPMHRADGILWFFKFSFAHNMRLSNFKYKPLKKYRVELSKRIYNRQLQ